MAVDVKQAKAIFLDVVHNVPVDRWSSYLDEACSGDAALAAQVDRLLKAHLSEKALATDAVQSVAAKVTSPAIECIGAQIGPYKLIEQIGEGGMGLVYMAEQQRPVRRLVALKIIKPGMDTKQVIARFEAERQALALMDHSNIARVLDVGTTEAGLPYFVMELVRGIPINEFCDQKRLTVRERLELFIQVCQAVQHAHQKGIIHRDLKPTNVLVTMADSVAVPKVIDFGIAKALGQSLTEHSLHTGFAQLVGTPLYMSPEQAEMNQFGVDTRSDVYSLGVMLYELLTGTTPFDKATLTKAGLDEMRRIIREQEPPRPSARLSTLEAQTLSTISDRRGIDPRRIATALRGELDWIVMKALEKDRGRRYESANSLAADVQRFLNDEQVHACPPSLVYRMQKIARRHKASVIAASLVLITMLASSAFSAAKYFDERAARREAVDQKLFAVESAKKAETEAVAAKRQRTEAVRQKGEAERQRDEARQNLYFADTRLANADLVFGNSSRARQSLLNHLPNQSETDRRGWEWFYLAGRAYEAEQMLESHRSTVYSVAWSADGDFLASSSFDWTVRVWNTKTWKLVRTFSQGPGPKNGVRWSPDSKKLAWGTFDDDSAVRIWNRETDEIAVIRVNLGNVLGLAWSHDGKRIATCSDRQPGNLQIWDAAQLRAITQFTADRGFAISWSPDDKLLATGRAENHPLLWEVATQQPVPIAIPPGPIRAAVWHPTQSRLFVADNSGSCVVWDHEAGQVVATWKNPWKGLYDLDWSADGSQLLGCDGDGYVKIVDPSTGHVLKSVAAHAGAVRSGAWEPSGKRFASAGEDAVVRIWKTETQPKPLVIDSNLQGDLRLAWDNEGTCLIVACGAAQKVVAFDATTGSKLEETPFAFDTNRRLASFRQIVTYSRPPGGSETISVSPAPFLGAMARAVPPTGVNTGLGNRREEVVSPDGSRIAYTLQLDGDKNSHESLFIFDIRARQNQPLGKVIDPHGIAWSPNGRFVAVVGRAEPVEDWLTSMSAWVHIFSADSGIRNRMLSISLRERSGTAVAWSHDGRKIAAADQLGHCVVWRVDSWEALTSQRIHVTQVNDLAWSHDDLRIASGGNDRQVHIWDSATGQELLALEAHTDSVSQIRWSLDGRKLAALSQDGQIKVWDASRGYELPKQEFWQKRLAEGDWNRFLHEISQKRWIEARDALRAHIAVIGEDLRALRALAQLELQLDDESGYRNACRRMLSAFANSDDAIELYQTAEVCAQRPGALENYSQVIRMARKMHELVFYKEKPVSDNAEKSGVLAAILFRGGEYEEALTHLRSASEFPANDLFTDSKVAYVRAMTHHRLGHTDDAKSWLDRANQAAEKFFDNPARPGWMARLITELIRREANEMIEGQAARAQGRSDKSKKRNQRVRPPGVSD